MIVIDLSQIGRGKYNRICSKNRVDRLEENELRFLIVDTLHTIITKLSSYYNTTNEIILAIDSKGGYWRKQIFPYYKQNRNKIKKESDIDWDFYFQCYNKIINELKQYSPYKVVDVDSCEADDIMYVCAKLFAPFVKVVLVTSDGDMKQLHNINVLQYHPFQRKFIGRDDYSLLNHILMGDSGDGIPNILTQDDIYMITDKRSNMLSKQRKELYNGMTLNEAENALEGEELDRFKRNNTLINLSNLPEHLFNEITIKIKEASTESLHWLDYKIKHQLIRSN